MAIDLTKPIKCYTMGNGNEEPYYEGVTCDEMNESSERTESYRLLFEKSPGLLTLAHVLADTDIEEMIAKADGSFENWVRGVRLGAKGFIAAIEPNGVRYIEVDGAMVGVPHGAGWPEMRDAVIAAAPQRAPLVMARDRVVDRYCEEHGLDKNNLSFEHIFKIRELPEWKNPTDTTTNE